MIVSYPRFSFALQRRFSRSFQVGLPDRKMRRAVLKKALEDVDVEDGFDWRELAANTEGYSCADIVELCREVRVHYPGY